MAAAAGRRPSESDLIAFARERLAGYKLPKSVDFTDGAAAQPERQTAQARAARAVLGGRRASHPLIRTVSRRRAANDVIDTDSWRSWPAGCSFGRSTTSARCGSTATQLGLAIARDYGAGTVFYAGQSLIELAGHGEPSAGGTMWLQVRDVYATEEELKGRGVEIARAGNARTVGAARDARPRSRRRPADLRPGAREPPVAARHQTLSGPRLRAEGRPLRCGSARQSASGHPTEANREAT